MMQKKSKIIISAIILLLIVTFSTSKIFAVGVKPLVIDLKTRPGQNKNFKLTLIPGNSEEIVNFSLYKLVQNLNGNLSYKKTKEKSTSTANWVELKENEVTVYPDQKTTVSGTVNVPYDAEGSHTVVIMVEPQDPAKKEGQIKFMVRYAVRLNIRVDKPGLRPEAELANFDLVKNEAGKPQVETILKNPSKLDYEVSGELTIRDSERRLVDRLPLQSPASLKSKTESKSTRIYPGNKVKYLAKVNKRLEPGTYNLRAFFKYGENGQIIKSKKVTIKEGQFDFPDLAEVGAFSVKPKKIDLKLDQGARKSMVVNLNSEIGDKSQIVVGASPIKSEYKYSALKWIKLRGKEQFDLRGRGKNKVILTTAVPRDVKDGSYHGNVFLKAYSPEDEKLLTEKKIPVSILVGKEHNYEVEMKSLHTKKVEKGHLISVDLQNSGNTFIEPQVNMIISDQDGKFIEKLDLKLPEGTEKILPLRSKRVIGTAEKLESGKYQAKITIKRENKELKTIEKDFEI